MRGERGRCALVLLQPYERDATTHRAANGYAISAPLLCQFLSAGRNGPGIAGDHRDIHRIGPTVRGVVEHLGAGHQRDVAGAAAMDGARFTARYRSGRRLVVDG